MDCLEGLAMPSVTRKEHNFMQAVKHGFKPTREKGPSKAVAAEFVAADKAAGKFQGHRGRMERLKSKR